MSYCFRHLTRASHIILDEVHERDIQSDFLIIVVRELLRVRPNLKIVLMSATLNAEMFSQYFGNYLLPLFYIYIYIYIVLNMFYWAIRMKDLYFNNMFFPGNCPMLNIPGFTYAVEEFLLEDIIEMTE